jgi:membrane-bound metal-dependent hydrolase YbcI (DUF457 family)
MKWHNHKLTTFGLVMLTNSSFLYAFIAASGSCIPDMVEGRPASSHWRNRHRGISHYIVPYLLTAFLLGLYGLILYEPSFISLAGLSIDVNPPLWGAFFFLGGALHILEDSISGTVPLLYPERRIGIRIIPVGHPVEYVLSYAVFFLSLVLKMRRCLF